MPTHKIELTKEEVSTILHDWAKKNCPDTVDADATIDVSYDVRHEQLDERSSHKTTKFNGVTVSYQPTGKR